MMYMGALYLQIPYPCFQLTANQIQGALLHVFSEYSLLLLTPAPMQLPSISSPLEAFGDLKKLHATSGLMIKPEVTF